MVLTTLQEAADYFDEMLDQHPERDLQDAIGKALKGEKREYPCFMMQQNAMEVVTDADVPNEMPIPTVRACPRGVSFEIAPTLCFQRMA